LGVLAEKVLSHSVKPVSAKKLQTFPPLALSPRQAPEPLRGRKKSKKIVTDRSVIYIGAEKSNQGTGPDRPPGFVPAALVAGRPAQPFFLT
jgi:hypothetical protein